MSLFDSICCCVGVDRNRPKSLQKLRKEDENKQPVLLDNSKIEKVEPKIMKDQNDKLQTSLQNLKAETQLKQNRKVVEPQQIILQKYQRQSQLNYGDDKISSQYADHNSRKIKTISREQFFILPGEPIMQFYQHQALQIQGMLPSDDIQYY